MARHRAAPVLDRRQDEPAGHQQAWQRVLRKILIHGVRAAVLRIKRDRTPIGAWPDRLDARAHKNVVVIAMANKLARTAWAVLSSGTTTGQQLCQHKRKRRPSALLRYLGYGRLRWFTFKRRHFPVEIILVFVRWYCRYGISYRDLTAMMQERGVEVDPSTIMQWVHRYAPELEKRVRIYQRHGSTSWRVDETYVR